MNSPYLDERKLLRTWFFNTSNNKLIFHIMTHRKIKYTRSINFQTIQWKQKLFFFFVVHLHMPLMCENWTHWIIQFKLKQLNSLFRRYSIIVSFFWPLDTCDCAIMNTALLLYFVCPGIINCYYIFSSQQNQIRFFAIPTQTIQPKTQRSILIQSTVFRTNQVDHLLIT